MRNYKILFLNLGYARGIAGGLGEHLRFAHRHIYCPPAVQKKSLQQLSHLLAEERPDICCFVEVEQGSFGNLNQIELIRGDDHLLADIENKYGRASFWRHFAPTSGKSNGFVARQKYEFEKLFFTRGVKRLVYKIRLADDITLFFAHFSLKKTVRARQIMQAHEMMRAAPGEVLFLGDFNILSGLAEIEPMLDGGHFVLLNRSDVPTFFFHKQKRVLDLCLCTPGLAARAQLRIVPQPYTDHAALILNFESA